MVKNLPATQDTQIQYLDWEDSLEEGRTTHSHILAWRIPWTEELGKLQSMESQRAAAAAATAKSLQSCPTLCDPIDGSPWGSHPWDSPGKNTGVGCHFLLQAWKWKVKVKSLSRVWLLGTPWTTRLLCPWDFPVKSTGVGRQCLIKSWTQLIKVS